MWKLAGDHRRHQPRPLQAAALHRGCLPATALGARLHYWLPAGGHRHPPGKILPHVPLHPGLPAGFYRNTRRDRQGGAGRGEEHRAARGPAAQACGWFRPQPGGIYGFGQERAEGNHRGCSGGRLGKHAARCGCYLYYVPASAAALLDSVRLCNVAGDDSTPHLLLLLHVYLQHHLLLLLLPAPPRRGGGDCEEIGL